MLGPVLPAQLSPSLRIRVYPRLSVLMDVVDFKPGVAVHGPDGFIASEAASI